MKKIFTFFIALVASVSAIYASDIKVGGIWYNFNHSKRTASVTYRGDSYDSYSNEYSGSVVIPSSVTYQGATYSVTSIGEWAFYDCSSLTSVTIPNSVTSIKGHAFRDCYYLTSVTIPESVTSIGNRAFYCCYYLTSVTIHESVTSIGEMAFSGLTSVTINSDAIVNKQYSSDFNLSHIFGSIIEFIIGESVTSIGDYAFCDCSSLTSITIPNSVTSIGNEAFYGCSSLTSVTIPNSVTSIGERAFFWCSSLTSLTIPNSVTSIGDGAFLGCSSLTSITIPNRVTRIGDDTFHFCSSLTSITIPNSVKSIGDEAFYGCSSLTSVTIPNSVTSIGSGAFYHCSSLTSITIPNRVTSIGDDTFCYCSSLTSITIPNSVTSIGNEAFYGCSSLTSVTIPESVISIGHGAFEGCSSLTSITIPNKVTSIGDDAFRDCSSLTSITIPNSVTSIGEYTFYNCSSLTSVTIGESVTSIGWNAFYGCYSLTSVTIGESVTSIGEDAFYGCSSLSSVTINSDAIVSKTYSSSSNISDIFGSIVTEYIIGESVTSIGDEAFYGCSSLTSVTIGESVTSIGQSAFNDCSSLTSITCKAATPPTIGDIWTFDDVSTSIPVYVPCESIQSYREHNQWGRFQNLQCVKPEDPKDSEMCLNSADERAVFFQGEEFGTSANVYMWDPANDNKELVGSWPGSAATHLGDGKFKFVIPTSVTGDPSTWMIIWNNGIGGTQTKDLTFTMHGLYNMSGVQSVITTLCDGGEIPVDPKPEDPKPEDPQDSEMCLNSADERAVFFQGEEFGTSANVYMWDPANDNKELVGSWPGSAATHLGDGKFKFVIPTSVTGDPSTWMIIWNNGIGGTQTKDLTFTMHGLYNMSGVQSVITTLCDGSNTDDPNEEVITCAEAVSICQQTGTTATTKEYTIRGYVTKIEAAYSEQYDNITFWMADTSPMQMDNSSNSVTSISDYPNIALGKSTTASSSQNSGTLPEYINDGDFSTRWSSEWQDNEYITIDLEQYSFIDHITLHWETAYASQFAILITDEQPSSSTLSSPLPSSATYYQSSGDVQTIPVAKSGRYITLIGIERATAYGISLYELEAYGMPLLQAYCVKPIQNTDKYVQIGDYIEAVGTLVNYGGTTPEINAGGTYTILTTTAVENTQIQSSMTNCQKIIRNGQLIIIRDGIEYNAVGQEM